MAVALAGASAGVQHAVVERFEFRPQPGTQEAFLNCRADITGYGGAAGSGKSYAELLDPLRGVRLHNFDAVIFRRESTRITEAGGLWDTATEIYPFVGARPNYTQLAWDFPTGARVKFGHMEHEKDRFKYAGAQIGMLAFDELQEFTEKQFWFMLSRLRSAAGIRPWVRFTCNPVPDDDPIGGWLRRLIDWWIDEATGLPIHKRSGVRRWFARIGDDLNWSDTKRGLLDEFGPDCPAMSFTFIPAKLTDNPALLKNDPGYMVRLKNLPLVDRERLLYGNWNARESAGDFFKRQWFQIVDAAPASTDVVRYWDRAATPAEQAKGTGSHTAGVRMLKTTDGRYFITDVVRFQGGALDVERAIKNTAAQDGTLVRVGIEQDPGQAGKAEANYHIRNLAGFDAHANVVREAKGVRARPLSAQAEGGNVYLVKGPWVEAFLREAENFDGTDRCQSDQIDAASGAFYMLTNYKVAGVWGRR